MKQWPKLQRQNRRQQKQLTSRFTMLLEMENIEAVKQHLAADADVNWTDEIGQTLLHYVAIRGHNEIAELLIAKGADVSAKSDDGRTPLHIVAISGHKEIGELLITNGADVNAKDNFEYTPLHGAATLGRNEIVELLIAKGADVNAVNDDDFTPLDEAIDDYPEIAVLLRKHGGKTGEELKAEGK